MTGRSGIPCSGLVHLPLPFNVRSSARLRSSNSPHLEACNGKLHLQTISSGMVRPGVLRFRRSHLYDPNQSRSAVKHDWIQDDGFRKWRKRAKDTFWYHIMMNILISLVKDAAIDYNSTLLFLFMFFLLLNLISLFFSTFFFF